MSPTATGTKKNTMCLSKKLAAVLICCSLMTPVSKRKKSTTMPKTLPGTGRPTVRTSQSEPQNRPARMAICHKNFHVSFMSAYRQG